MDKQHVEPVVTSPAEDSYDEFLKGQRKRQAVWNEQRAASRAKVVHTPTENKNAARRDCYSVHSPRELLKRRIPTGFSW